VAWRVTRGGCCALAEAGRGAKSRHGWIGVAQVVAVAAIAVGALAAIYAERSTMREGFVALRYARGGWLLAGFSAEFVSMAALAQLERSLLRGVGARHTLRSVLATAYSSNAISVTVPILDRDRLRLPRLPPRGGQGGARQRGPDGRGRLLDRRVRGGRGNRRAGVGTIIASIHCAGTP
jgi:hypothetical protein